MSDSEDDLRNHETHEPITHSIDHEPNRTQNRPGKDCILASPHIGHVTGGNLKDHDHNGVDRLQNHDILHLKSVALKKQYHDGHVKHKPLGYLDGIEPRYIRMQLHGRKDKDLKESWKHHQVVTVLLLVRGNGSHFRCILYIVWVQIGRLRNESRCNCRCCKIDFKYHRRLYIYSSKLMIRWVPQ